MSLVGKHPFSGSTRPPPFLAANFLNPSLLGRNKAFLHSLDLVEQHPPRQEPVHPLLSRALAFDAYPCGPVHQHDASGGLVDVLAAVAAGANKCLLKIGLAHAKRGHALHKLRLFLERNWKRIHAPKVEYLKEDGNSQGELFDLLATALEDGIIVVVAQREARRKSPVGLRFSVLRMLWFCNKVCP